MEKEVPKAAAVTTQAASLRSTSGTARIRSLAPPRLGPIPNASSQFQTCPHRFCTCDEPYATRCYGQRPPPRGNPRAPAPRPCRRTRTVCHSNACARAIAEALYRQCLPARAREATLPDRTTPEAPPKCSSLSPSLTGLSSAPWTSADRIGVFSPEPTAVPGLAPARTPLCLPSRAAETRATWTRLPGAAIVAGCE